MKLSASEKKAIHLLEINSGSLLVTRVADTTSTDVFGDVIPGKTVFGKLIKKGLVFQTEDEADFTASYELTEDYKQILNDLP